MGYANNEPENTWLRKGRDLSDLFFCSDLFFGHYVVCLQNIFFQFDVIKFVMYYAN